MRRILGAILGLTAATNAISIKQLVGAEAEPTDVAEAQTIAEAVAFDKDTRGHDGCCDGCCGGNKVDVDVDFSVNLGAKQAPAREVTPTSDTALMDLLAAMLATPSESPESTSTTTTTTTETTPSETVEGPT